MSYRTFLFDFDYTLADSSRGIVRCFRNVLEQHGFMQTQEDAIKRTIGKTLEESFSILTGITDSETLAQYRKEYVKEADRYMNSNTVLFDDAVQTLQALRQQGCQTGIISTKYRYRIHDFLKQTGTDGLVDLIVGGEDVKKAKPDPEGIRKALHALSALPEQSLYIGDSVTDALAAQKAGIDFIGVTNGVTTREELAAHPHKAILHSLSELTAWTD